MRKNILYIGGFELPDKNAAAHRVVNNSKIFRDMGHKVIFINSKKKENVVGLKENKFDVWNFNYPSSYSSWLKYLVSIKNIKKVVNKYKKIDVIIAYNYPSIALIRLKSFCNKHNIKLVADCTEWYSAKGRNLFSRLIKDFDTSLRMKTINKKIDGIIVISKLMKSYYKNQNTILVPPLVDLNDEKWKIRKSHLNNKSTKLVYAGSPDKEKDKINLIIESLYSNKNLDFMIEIVGIEKHEYLEMHPEHKNIVIELEEKIKFLGRMPHLKTLEVLSSADFSIYLRESSKMINAGFPTKFVESITLGVPSITTNISDLTDYMNNDVNGYFIDLDNKEGIKNDIRNILSISYQKKSDLRKECEDFNKFHYENYLADFSEFFEKI